MKAEDKLEILKFLIMLVNSLFVILGISLFGCSAWILFDKTSFISVLNSEENVKAVAGGLFVIGLVVVGVSLLGCVGAHIENRCFIAFYMGFLMAIVLGQVFVTFLLLLKRNQIERILNERVDGIISNYGGNDSQTSWSLLDSLQKSAACCGRKNPSDWQTNKLLQVQNKTDIYPCSCFNGTCPLVLTKEIYTFGNGSHIYTTGCGDKLNDWFQSNVFVIVGMDFGLLLIQILQFTLGVHVYRTISLKMKERHSRNLLNAVEQSVSSDPDVRHCGQENHSQNNRTQLQKPHDQEYGGQSYNQHPDQRHEAQTILDPNSHIHTQIHTTPTTNAQNQVHTGQSYGQYEDLYYQHNDGFDNNSYIHNYDQ